MTLSALIESLTAATGPDRELDRDIALAVFPFLRDLPPSDCGGWIHPEYGKIAPPSHYTGSLDAALTLLPLGYVWECGFGRFVPHCAVVRSMAGAHDGWTAVCNSTRAIALCIAALRARSALGQGE